MNATLFAHVRIALAITLHLYICRWGSFCRGQAIHKAAQTASAWMGQESGRDDDRVGLGCIRGHARVETLTVCTTNLPPFLRRHFYMPTVACMQHEIYIASSKRTASRLGSRHNTVLLFCSDWLP